MANIIENWSKEHPKFYKFLSEVGFLVFIVIVILIIFKVIAPIEKLDDDGLVIGFIGVLATFIVIGNFSQINRIENNVETEIGNLRERLIKSEEKTGQIKTLTETISNHTGKIATIENMMESASKSLDEQDLAHLLKLFVGKEGDVRKYMQLYARMLDPDSTYHIELVNQCKVLIRIEYNESTKDLVFRKSVKEEIEAQHISKISGLTFNHDDLLFAYQLLHSIVVTDKDTNEDDKTKEEIFEDAKDTKNNHKEVEK